MVTLETNQNIQNISDLYGQLKALLDSHKKIEIDASDVRSIDTATLQLLIILKLSAEKLQQEVTINFPSEEFVEAAELLGLAKHLDVDHAASGFF